MLCVCKGGCLATACNLQLLPARHTDSLTSNACNDMSEHGICIRTPLLLPPLRLLQVGAPALAVPTATGCVGPGVLLMLQTCVLLLPTWQDRRWWTLPGCALTGAVQGATPHWRHWPSGAKTFLFDTFCSF